jgi:PadR family transcriptional regulator, regulatory protein AphA
MAKRTSSSTEALLGLLSIEPMSGYDLGQAIRASIGYFWNESYGQIYPNLKSLEANGCVARKLEKQKGRPDRQIYSITKKGRQRLEAWLSVEPQPEIPRNELLLKLFFGAQSSAQILIGHVTQMAEREQAILDQVKRIEEKEIAQHMHLPDAPYWLMAARFGQLELEAHVRWAEETIAALRVLARNQQKRTTTRTRTRKEKHDADK